MIIGCWAQPPESLKKWKSDGCTVVFNPDRGSMTQDQTHQACEDAGMMIVDRPDTPEMLEKMIARKSVLWISLGDEPELKSPNYNTDPAGFQKYVADWMTAWKWIADKTARRKPLFVNFAGPKIGAAGSPYGGQNQAPYAALTGAGDVISCDWYPKNMQADRYPTTYCGEALARMKTWWPNRQLFCFLECSDQVLDGTLGSGVGRAPTPVEMEEELKSVMDQGIVGFSWFSHQFKGLPWDRAGEAGKTAWDGRTPDLLAKTREIAARLNPKPVDPFVEILKRLQAVENDVAILKQSAVKDISVVRF